MKIAKYLSLGFWFAAVLVLAACSSAPSDPTAAAARTRTRPSPEQALGTALAKNETLSVYRVEIYLGSDPSKHNSNGIVGMYGVYEINQPDALVKMQTFYTSWEKLAVKGKVYDAPSSPSPRLLTEQEQKDFRPHQDVNRWLKEWIGEPATWHAGESDTLDGIECEVYTQDKDAALNVVLKSLGKSNPSSGEIAQLAPTVQAQAWLCEDGYLHQLRITAKPFPNADWLISFHLYDVNGDVQIVPPPVRPALVAPGRNQVLDDARVELDWDAVEGAESYTVSVRVFSRAQRGGPRFGDALADVSGLTETRFETPELPRGQMYFWQVSACNALGCAPAPCTSGCYPSDGRIFEIAP